MSRILLAACIGLCVAGVDAGELPPRTSPAPLEASRCIPTDSIWYSGSTGKMSLRRLEPDLLVYRDTPENIKKYGSPEGISEMREKAKKSLVIKIEKALRDLPLGLEKVTPGQGFVVRGTAREALPGTVDVLVDGKKPVDQFTRNDELSLVMFTNPTGMGIRIDSIEIEGTSIRATYYLAPSAHPTISPVLYLVPLGKLPTGDYSVEFIRAANDASRNLPGFPPIPVGAEKYTVCRPFDFAVGDLQPPSPTPATAPQ